VTWLWLPDTPRDVRWLNQAEQQHVEQRVAEEDAATRARHVGSGSLATALLHPTVWLLGLVLFACQCGSYGLTLWIPQIVKGISAQSDLLVGFIAAIPYIGATVAMLWVGASSDRTGERFLHVAVPSFIGAVGFAASAFLLSPVAGMLALAAGIALVNTMGSLGGFVGPYAVGAIRQATGEFTWGLLFLAGLLVLASAGTLVLRRTALLRE
jgi:ACS family tartrate transporter-like MFS transporter